jgi:hypothetical protein
MAGLLFYQAGEQPALFVIRGDAQDLNYLKTRDWRDAPNDNLRKLAVFHQLAGIMSHNYRY